MRVDSFLTAFASLLAATAAHVASPREAQPETLEARQVSDPGYWLKDMTHRGRAAFNPNPNNYAVWRNVKDYGAKGDGRTDDTAAINAAISSGGRCGPFASCESSTVTPAIIYFPAGTYVVSTSIINYYNTQLIGNPNSLPVIKATSNFRDDRQGIIDGNRYQDGGNQGWTSTNVFLRQIRNFVIDMTAIPANVAATGIHWPTSQATSIQNVVIRMNKASNSQQQGIFIENGSGGFLTDLTITGGLYGMNVGNQQFTMRNVNIDGAVTGISMIWNWGWTWQGLTISNCGTAISMSNGGSNNLLVGSMIVLDSTITSCSVFVDSAWTTGSTPKGAGGLILENIQLNNVPVAVRGPSGTVLNGGTTTINSWGQGNRYTPNGPNKFQGAITGVARPGALLADGSYRYFTKSKPQYANLGTSSFVSVKAAGAKGDGQSDDTSIVQSTINSATNEGKIVFFDHGVYKVTGTITVPPGARIVGEAYAVIAASGGPWQSSSNPVPVIKIGSAGQSGSFEWSDMIVSTIGPAPGAVLIEWNLAATKGSGMWDVHTRIGGWTGSQQQVAQCPTSLQPTARCMAAYMSMHITSTGKNVYMENNWLWTGDHDLDDARSTRISVWTGRGLLIEGSAIWLYGTGVEHHFLYQYQFTNAVFVFATYMQTETPYYQPNPDVRNSPYPRNTAWNDPDYSKCLPGNCSALGLRILNSQNLFLYGVGLYSFFNNYSTTCSDLGKPSDCQSQIFSIEGNAANNIWIYTLNTIGAQNMIVIDGKSVAWYADNLSTFAQTIAYFTYRLGK